MLTAQNHQRLPRSRSNRGMCSAVILFLFSMLVFCTVGKTGRIDAAEPDKLRASPPSPLSPADALKHFELHPKLKIELVASEPDVIDPVAIAFDENGRLWVVEMTDYPNGPKPGESPKSRIRVLEDSNGDGKYDRSQVFADKLLFVSGVQPWKGGVIVTLAGEVAYFKDSDGDGKADQGETWFTGFKQENSQLRANHPTFGLDNHIYIANGLRGGVVIAKKEDWAKDAKPVSISGMDFRFNPTSGKYEAISGNGQFGLTFDDFGNRFNCSNRNPCKHIVLEDRYIKRNPFLVVRTIFHDVSPSGFDSRVYPISRTWTTSTLHAGQFTAACGVTIYRGDALPAEFLGNSFTCEPTGNLVHRDVRSPSGATFQSRPGREKVEFLASRDEWFRPVNLATGPDGALYVVDMYRAVIEHPQWVPDELKNRPDERYGDTRGRIYRIVPKKSTSRSGSSKIAKLGTSELVELLAHRNAWQRETAARLIYERQDTSAEPKLNAMAITGRSPQAKIHALWALSGLGKLSEQTILEALDDPHPRVREHAVRLSETFLKSDNSDRLRAKLVRLAQRRDNDDRLRFQLALSLGEVKPSQSADVTPALVAIAVANAKDPWTRQAVISSTAQRTGELFTSVLHQISASKRWAAAGRAELIEELGETVASQQNKSQIETSLSEIAAMVTTDTDRKFHDILRLQLAGIQGLGRGLARRGRSLSSYRSQLSKSDEAALQDVFRHAIQIAGSEDADADLRRIAISALQHTQYSQARPTLTAIARDQTNQDMRLAAIAVLARFQNADIADVLLSDFQSQTPPVRRAVLDAMLANVNRTRRLLTEIEQGRMAVSEFDPTRVKRLMRHRDQQIREKAKQLMAAAIPADRREVLKKYQNAITLKADPNNGRLVFQKNCAACHRIGGLGVNVAPDIADSRAKKPLQLLTSILDPNRAIDSNYFSYSIVTTQGKLLTGIIAAETASSITLRQQENKTVSVLRQDIEEMRSNGVSLMPVGLEKNVNVQQMADLVSFIKNWRYLSGRIPIQVGK